MVAATLALATREGNAVVIWAAGIGNVASSAEEMRAETETLALICNSVAALDTGQRERTSFLFASSAGALFAGNGRTEIVETANPKPLTPYGFEKLRQEELLEAFALSAGCGVVICRYSNLFGLADGRLTRRGLVSTAVRATRLRQPMIVYVSADTRRDYIYSVDAAAESLVLAELAPRGVTRALICGGETLTVSGILGLVGRVSGRRVPATYAERAETRVQPLALRFRAPDRAFLRPRRTPMETALHLMLRAPLSS